MMSRFMPLSTLSTSYTVLPPSVSFAEFLITASGYDFLNAAVTAAGNWIFAAGFFASAFSPSSFSCFASFFTTGFCVAGFVVACCAPTATQKPVVKKEAKQEKED